MLNLREYRSRADRLADHLPWAALVAPGVVLNKDGSFQRTLRFRGPDLESATEAELVGACARANNVLKRFGSGWALHFEAERREALGYPQGRFPEAASWLVDEERRAAFEAAGRHFESRYHLTLTYMPPVDQADTAGRALVERSDDAKGRDWRQALAGFIANIRTLEKALGDGRKRPTAAEKNTAALARRSIVLLADVEAGETLTAANCGALRPGTGLPPRMLDSLLGLKVRKAMAAGTVLSLADLG